MQSHKKTEQICRKKLRETLSQSKVYDFLASKFMPDFSVRLGRKFGKGLDLAGNKNY